jgi:hypothetical protein
MILNVKKEKLEYAVLRTLDQWKDVDPNNRTKFDAYISSSLSRVGNRRKIRVVEEAKNNYSI